MYTLRRALPYIHRGYVREYLPRRPKRFNGVDTRAARLFDRVVPWPVGHHDPEQYEPAILAALREYVNPGDDVVIVGGGWGVSSVVAARKAGARGSVQTYEASVEYSRFAQETVALNGVDQNVTIHNAVIGRTVSTRGSKISERMISPSDLPQCDVLELDCEGAEIDILEEMSVNPRVIIVESHGVFGAPTVEVTSTLEGRGYVITSINVSETGVRRERCVSNDVYVIVAVRDDCRETTDDEESITLPE
jgi:hypothetical protein